MSPHHRMDEPTAHRVVELIAELHRVSGHRVHATILPSRLSDDECIALTQVLNMLLDAWPHVSVIDLRGQSPS